MFAPVAEIGIVTFVLDQTAGVSDGGAVTLEKAADLGEAHSASDMPTSTTAATGDSIAHRAESNPGSGPPISIADFDCSPFRSC